MWTKGPTGFLGNGRHAVGKRIEQYLQPWFRRGLPKEKRTKRKEGKDASCSKGGRVESHEKRKNHQLGPAREFMPFRAGMGGTSGNHRGKKRATENGVEKEV